MGGRGGGRACWGTAARSLGGGRSATPTRRMRSGGSCVRCTTSTRRDEAAAGWGGEGAEGAAVETDAEEGLVGPGAAAMEDEVVARGFVQCEVGLFEAELADGAEGVEHAVPWSAAVYFLGSRRRTRRIEVLEELGSTQEALERPTAGASGAP
jgi:hypothetical protein